MGFLRNWCKGVLCILSISVLSACGGKSSSREVIFEGDGFKLELLTAKEPVSRKERKELSEQGVSPFSFDKSENYNRAVYKIEKVFDDGRVVAVWTKEELLSTNANTTLEPWYIGVQIGEVWSVDSRQYILFTYGTYINLLEMTESTDTSVKVRELKLGGSHGNISRASLSIHFSDDSLSIAVPVFEYRTWTNDGIKHYLVSTKDDFVLEGSIDFHPYYQKLTPRMWWALKESITQGVPSTVEAEQAIASLERGDAADTEKGEPSQWWKALSPQARSKVCVEIACQIYDAAARKQVNSEEESGVGISGWTPVETMIIGGYLEQMGLSSVSNLSIDSFTKYGRFDFTLRPYLENDVVQRVLKQLSDSTHEERLAYARNPQPVFCPTEIDVALKWLAYDDEPEVRLAVIENPWTDPIVVLSMRADETDPTILAALDAYEKEVHIIPPEEERPLPPDW